MKEKRIIYVYPYVSVQIFLRKKIEGFIIPIEKFRKSLVKFKT